jgi:hypothetical protein
MHLRLFICLLLSLTSLRSIAQYTGYDTSYVKENYNKLCVTGIAESIVYELTLNNKNSKGKDLHYLTNPPTAYGLGLDYKWLTLSYTYAFKFLNESDPNKGFTKADGFSLGVTSNRFWARAFYRTQEGMYLSNASDFERNDLVDMRRNDITGSSLYGNFNYIFRHKKYSQNATLWQIDQQLKSAGTFTVGAAAAIYTTKADSSLVPTVIKDQFPEKADIRNSQSQSYAITAGYMHTFVLAKVSFIHLGLIPGICFQQINATLADGTTRSNNAIGGYTELRLVMGYNGKKYYGGLNTSAYIFTENRFDATLDHSYTFVRLFFGMRLPLKLKLPFQRYL